MNTYLSQDQVARHVKPISSSNRLTGELENPIAVGLAASNRRIGCMRKFVESDCTASVGRDLPLRVRFELQIE